MSRQAAKLAILAILVVQLSSIAASISNQKSATPFEPPLDDDFVYTNATKLYVGGRAFNDTKLFYTRLPAAAEGAVRSEVWALSEDAAGIFVQFATDAPGISVLYTLLSSTLSMWHFPASGVSGVDVYAFDSRNGTWRWLATSAPSDQVAIQSVNVSLADVLQYERRMQRNESGTVRIRINLPTYNVVGDMHVGVPSNSSDPYTLVPDRMNGSSAPIVWYGTSIAQGGVTSRPGQIFTHLISRNLSREVLNFGFSGNGKMEISVAQFLTTIDAAMFVIDCNHNMDGPTIAENVVPLVNYLRQNGHSSTPIVLVEDTPLGAYWYGDAAKQLQDGRRASLRQGFDNLTKAGDRNLFYVSGPQFYNNKQDNFTDPTVGGVHPTDLGHRQMASFYYTYLPSILEKSSHVRAADERLARRARRLPTHIPSYSIAYGETFPKQPNGSSQSERRDKLDQSSFDENPMAECTLSPVSAVETLSGPSLTFKSAQVFGRGFADVPSDHFFSRLPAKANGTVRAAVFDLAQDSAGIFLRFVTDATELSFQTLLMQPSFDFWRMPPSGTSGFDLFMYDGANTGSWRHVCVTEIHSNVTDFAWATPKLGENNTNRNNTYLLYLPLRNAPLSGTITAADGTLLVAGGGVEDVAPAFSRPPIVWYGTSIQQGIAASRPGHTYDAFISRSLGVEVINLGFDGNGVEELTVAQFLTQLNASIIVIDCLPNMNATEVAQRTVPLVKYLREHGHSNTPIVLPEGSPAAAYNHWPSGLAWEAEKIAALRNSYKTLVEQGDKNIYYVHAYELLPDPFDNPTVEGVHPSDLGQQMVAQFYARFFGSLLKGQLTEG